MSFIVGMYRASIANGSVLLACQAATDQILQVSSAGFLVPDGAPWLLGCAGLGVTLSRIQLTSPTIRDVAPLEVAPVNRGTKWPTPEKLFSRFRNPIQLKVAERLDCNVIQGAGAAEVEQVLVWFGTGAIEPVKADCRTIRATGTTTLTANAWSTVALTLDTTIDPGQYSIVGARCETATGLAFRFVPASAGDNFRPGFVCDQAVDDGDAGGDAVGGNLQRNGALGEWLKFKTTALPAIEVWATAADTAETVWLDIIRTGGL